MALQIRQNLRQTQQLVMTPQLRQAIKLLQYNHQDMITALEAEIRENPFLEDVPLDEPFAEAEAPNRNDLKALEDEVKEPKLPEIDSLGSDWESYLESYGGDYAPVDRDYSERPPLENMVSYEHNLFDHLLEQLQLSRIEGDDRRIALELIGNVDENGYLDWELEEVARNLKMDVSDVERVLGKVQEFDPTGIAARDVRECLLLQARAADPPNELVVRILEEAFDLFRKDRFKAVAGKLKTPLEEVNRACEIITSFDPKPGRAFLNRYTNYVIPDIYIIKVGGDYSILLNDDGLPRLRVSSFYRRQMRNAVSHPGAKNYIQEKMRGAMWLIKSVHQRQRTIYRVAKSILKFQRDFFDKGIDYLKPMVLRDVAEDIEMHESTISRVTANKYMHTPRGIFELKYFFNSGLRHGNDTIASESVKNHILGIIKQEDPQKPASDQQIVDELGKSRIHIARRTVAKYREVLGIPPSSKRKKKY